MELPRSVTVGHDAIKQVGDVCVNLKLGRRALVVADPTTMKIAGESVVQQLQARKIHVVEFLIPDANWEA
ncbi:MAG: NAD(P)-dependent glycerol-1-phosphate dehydrogenase, partial [Candidatus Thermoplasmatota archaeon]